MACCCCCRGFKALEFWILCLSLTAASLVGSTVCDPKSVRVSDTSNKTIADTKGDELTTPSNYDAFFFFYVFRNALVYTLLVLLLAHCCRFKDIVEEHGRKQFMLCVFQVMKGGCLIAIPLTTAFGYIKYKTGEPLVVGGVLLGYECLSVCIESLLLLHLLDSSSKRGLFVRTYVELMINAIVAAQMVDVRELHLLYATSGANVLLALGMTVCVSEIEYLDKFVGFAAGVCLAAAIEGYRRFKPLEESMVYVLLFGFNFILPHLHHKYENVTIPPEYERSYRRATLLDNQV